MDDPLWADTFPNTMRINIIRRPCAIRSVVMLSLVVAVFGYSATFESPTLDGPAVDEAAPIEAKVAAAMDLEGRSIAPVAASAGQVVVLTFVRTDCPVANRYAPTVRKVYEKFASEGVSFYLVYPNPDATAGEIREHVAEYEWPMTALRDPEHELVDLVGATVTPESAVFDRDGRLVYQGRIDDRFVDFGKTRPAPTTHDLEDAIAAALANERVQVPKTEAVGCYIADLK